jgi:hypothetical protein
MDIALEVAYRFGSAVGWMMLQPFYYIAILLVVLQYRRQIALERKLFHVRLHSLWSESWRVILWGAAAGLVASLAMAGVGSTIQPEALVLLWSIMLVLALFRFRWLCISYAVGIVGALQALLQYIPGLKERLGWEWLIRAVEPISIPSLLAVVVILHLVEAILVRKHAPRSATPLFFEGKRGKLIGGYHMQSFWPVPLILLVPMTGGAVGTGALPWMTLIGGDLWQLGWAFLPFPIVMGFAGKTITDLPADKVKRNSNLLIAYSLIVLLLAVCAYIWPIVTIGASLLTMVLHELLVWLDRWFETQKEPRFVHTERGLTILAVLPGSPADELGLKAGEVIAKVHGIPVRTKEKLHEALRTNPAFCKLEVLNLQGESKFVKRAIFEGDHHQLGVILAPDEDASYYMTEHPAGLISYIRSKLAGVQQRTRPL